MSVKNLMIRTETALECFDGSVAKLAKYLGIRPAAIYQWGDCVPTVRAYQLREDFPHLAEPYSTVKTIPTAENGATTEI